MPIRIRKLIGALALLILVSVWLLVAMALAQFPRLQESRILAGIYYLLAGLGWVLPAMLLIRWMTVHRRRKTDD